MSIQKTPWSKSNHKYINQEALDADRVMKEFINDEQFYREINLNPL